MSKFSIVSLSVLILCAVVSFAADAEVIYLNDGQVITGVITAETKDDLTVKTKFQTKRVKRSDVTRIMYGERKMEPITLLMNNGTTVKGFLVDQDAEKVIIRDKEDSAEERNIPKSQISQMSSSDIVPLAPTILFRGGIFYPMNSQGAKLSPSAIGFVQGDVTFRWVKNLRVLAEAGFSKCTGKSHGLYEQFVPLHAGGYYDIAFGSFHLQPKLAMGTTMIDFNDGENTKTRSFAFSTGVSLGCVYEVLERHFFVGFWPEYYFMRDSSANLHSIAANLSLGYRF